jgi:hypothetical protein
VRIEAHDVTPPALYSIFATAARWAVGCLLSASIALKSLSGEAAISHLAEWRIIPEWGAVSLLHALIFVESVGFRLLLSRQAALWRAGARLVIGMLAIFCVAAVIEYAVSGSVSCGCFGGASSMDARSLDGILVRNSTLALLLLPSALLFRGIK